MDKQKKIWYCEQYLQRLYTISMCMMQEAARAGEHGKGYAECASETRTMTGRLTKYVEQLRFDGEDVDNFSGIVDCTLQLNFLALNTAIQAMNMVDVSMEFNIPKSMSVYAAELRNLTAAFNELSDNTVWEKPFVMPEVANPVAAKTEVPFSEWETIFSFSIGNAPLCENLAVMREIIYAPVKDIQGETYRLRGDALPILDCYKKAKLPGFKSNFPAPSGDCQPVLIMEVEKGKVFALPVDDLDFTSAFHTIKGTDVPVESSHPFAKFTRLAWDATAGGQLVFLDWTKVQNA